MFSLRSSKPSKTHTLQHELLGFSGRGLGFRASGAYPFVFVAIPKKAPNTYGYYGR